MVGLGVGKVFAEKAHPPAYALKPGNHYDGFVSGDRFSQRAEHFRVAFSGQQGGWRRLGAFLRQDLHPTTLVVPALVGALAFATGSVPHAFLSLSVLACLLQVALVYRIALLADERKHVAVVAALVFSSHVLVIRTCGQLIMDPFCSAAALASVLLAFRGARGESGSWFGWILVSTAGVFTKISYLPLLAAPTIVLLRHGSAQARSCAVSCPRRVLRALSSGGALAAVPLPWPVST